MMTEPDPQVSICIPVHNGERFLELTLDSVLAQDCPDLEIVVLDNASTDATAGILERHRDDPRVRIEANETLLPLAENWRRATELTRAPLVKVVCADDVITPTSVREQAEVLRANPEISLVGSRRDVIDDSGHVIHAGRGLRGLIGRHHGSTVARQVAWTGINPIGESAAVMFRRSDYDAVGGWNPELVYPMDIRLWFDLLTRGDLYGMRAVHASYRMSDGSLTSLQTPEQLREHRTYLRRLVDDPRWRLAPAERLASRVMAPVSFRWWGLRHRLRGISAARSKSRR